jgi:hypothetical protein
MRPQAALLLLCLGLVSFCSCADLAARAANDSFLAGFNGPFPTITGYAGTEMSSTVSLLYQTDWDVEYRGRATEDWNSRCIEMLDRAAMYKAKTVNFMITHYWVDKDFNGEVSCFKLRFGLCWTLEPLSCHRNHLWLQGTTCPHACAAWHAALCCIKQHQTVEVGTVMICCCRLTTTATRSDGVMVSASLHVRSACRTSTQQGPAWHADNAAAEAQHAMTWPACMDDPQSSYREAALQLPILDILQDAPTSTAWPSTDSALASSGA